jgi:hypothetical protein
VRLLDLFCGAGGAAIADRFWSHVAVGEPDSCWPWTASKRPTGYGQMNVGRVPEKAHRISFLIAYGTLPALVMHTCDNPPCVNPRHLRAGTQRENLNDAARKRRTAHKLNAGQVNNIRWLIERGWSHRDAARMFGVAHSTVGRIINGRYHRHV